MLGAACLAAALSSFHLGGGIATRQLSRAHAPMMSDDECVTPPAVLPIESADGFALEIGTASDNVKAVKFVAKNCRGCMAMKPKFDQLAKANADSAHFFEVNFANGRAIFGSERVRRTPTVLYYCGELGRVGGFPFGPTPATGDLLKRELQQVVQARPRLLALRPEVLGPPMRFKALVGLLRALACATERLEEDAQSRGTSLESLSKGGALAETRKAAAAAAAAARASSQAELAAEATAIFHWLDQEEQGALDMGVIARVIDALGGDSPWGVTTGRVGAGGGTGLPTERDVLDAKLREGLAACGGEGESVDLAGFVNLWLLHHAYERAKLKPEAEVRAAFALLDANGSGGAVPRAQAVHTISSMCERLPGVPAGASGPEALDALFDAFDYEGKGHVHFECWARIVVRSSPSPWP